MAANAAQVTEKVMRKTLYALDFDKTILQDDSGVAISKARGHDTRILPTNDRKNWATYFQTFMDYIILIDGVKLEDILENLMRCKMLPGTPSLIYYLTTENLIRTTDNLIVSLPGMKDLLENVMKVKARNPASKFIIVSGCNDYFIDYFLKNTVPSIIPDEIISNRATRLEDPEPRLKFKAYEPEPQLECQWCNPSICKGSAIQKYMEEHGPFQKTFYAGDGKNDVCAATRLRNSDVLFVRNDFGLDRVIRRGTYKELPVIIKSDIVFFDTGYDILRALKCYGHITDN